MSTPLGPCLLCGSATTEVRAQLVEWLEPIGRERYSTIPRCTDRPACRARLTAIGDPWPVDDGTPPQPRPEDQPGSFAGAALVNDEKEPGR